MARYRAFYVISELAAIAGIEHGKLFRFLKRYGVLEEKLGNHWIVYGQDMRKKTPKFWEALVAIDNMREKLKREQQEADDFKAESWGDDDDEGAA